MDFVFDNIGVFALILYALIVFASKLLLKKSGGEAENLNDTGTSRPAFDEEETAHSRDYDFGEHHEEKATATRRNGKSYLETVEESEIAESSEPVQETEPTPEYEPAAVREYDGARKLAEEMQQATAFYGGASYALGASLEDVMLNAREAERLSNAPSETASVPPSQISAHDDRVKKFFGDGADIRRAIIASEILGKPKSLKDENFF